MDFSDNATRIILAVFALFAVGIAITFRITNKSKRKNNSKNLKNVSAGGDVVLGNKKTKSK